MRGGVRMKKVITLIIMVLSISTVTGCGKKENVNAVPELTRVRSICELATMESYYHNVAKVQEKDAGGFLFWKKDKHFWIEYSGVVTLGIDASLLQMDVDGSKVTITMPKAKLLNSKVLPESLTEDSYIVDKDSIDITAEDETKALTLAQENMEQTAAANLVLLENAEERAQELLEEYIDNVGALVGIDYEVEWKYLESNT